MSFIQCKDRREVEKKVKIGNFVSDDFRLYDQIEYYDDALAYTITAEDFKQFIDFRNTFEMMGGKFFENPFQNIRKNADELSKAFETAAEHFKMKIDKDD